MHVVSIIKISTAALTVFIGIICSYIELKKNSSYWLNRFFSLFFLSSAFGFFFYTLYHIILSNADLVIPFMITSQLIFQIAMSFLLMTEFVLDHSEKAALSWKFLLIAFIPLFLSAIGYAIWVPTLNMDDYLDGHVNTDTPTAWFIAVFAYRIGVMCFVLIKFVLSAKKSQGRVKTQMNLFALGMVISIGATILTLLGGVPGIIGVILEIVGLLSFDFAVLVIYKGLTMSSKEISS